MKREEAIDVVRRVVAADNGRDRPGYRALLHDDYVAEVNGAVSHTGGDVEAEALARYWRGFPDGRIHEESIWADGGTVTLRYRLTGTNDGPLGDRPATGKKVDVAGCTILVVEQGRVRRVYRYLNQLAMAEQLGA